MKWNLSISHIQSGVDGHKSSFNLLLGVFEPTWAIIQTQWKYNTTLFSPPNAFHETTKSHARGSRCISLAQKFRLGKTACKTASRIMLYKA